jgi:hypothetical protein
MWPNFIQPGPNPHIVIAVWYPPSKPPPRANRGQIDEDEVKAVIVRLSMRDIAHDAFAFLKQTRFMK